MSTQLRAVRPQDAKGITSFKHPKPHKGGGGLAGRDPLERFEEKYEEQRSGCWKWIGAINSRGFGCFAWGGKGKTVLAHRWAWEHIGGKKLPAGKVLSHKEDCSIRHLCVNPDHMFLNDPSEAKRHGESPPATNAQATHCAYGHEFSGDNLRIRADGRRICVACQQKRQRAHDERQRARRLKQGLCPQCGKGRPEKGYSTCNTCRERNRTYMETYNARRRRHMKGQST